jgi:glutamyl-tRNA reductase
VTAASIHSSNCSAREPRDYGSHVYVHEDVADAIAHLFRGCQRIGFDGDRRNGNHRPGKNAYDIARNARADGPVLNRVFPKNFQAVKEIRAARASAAARPPSAAWRWNWRRRFSATTCRSTVIIIGAGQMGEACVRHLAKKGAKSILVSNRSFDRAVALANEFGGQAVRFESNA